MRYATEADGNLLIALHDGRTIEAATEVGGGAFAGDLYEGYEVHYILPDGEFKILRQANIREVRLAKTGEEVEFGNPYMGDGHPRPRALEKE